jgi:DNA-binding response OmpR family regulator
VLSLHKLDLNGPLGVVKISATEATLLQAFSQSPDARLDFQQVAQCMGLTPTPDEDYKTNIQVRMVRLRKKMHEAGAQGAVIESIRNVGYQFFEALEIRKS